MKTKIEIIEETVEYYQNNPRGLLGGRCLYLTPEGNMCAVGRCLINPKTFCSYGLWSLAELFGEGSSEEEKLNSLLKEDYRGHSVNFWVDLQILHDTNEYWNGQALTDGGKEFLESIKQEAK